MLFQGSRVVVMGLFIYIVATAFPRTCDGACPFYAYESTISFGGIGTDRAFDVVKASDGAVVLVGEFSDTVDFDPGEGTDVHTANGACDVFVSYYHPNGSYGWTRTVGGINGDTAFSAAVDQKGSIYVTGTFFNTVDFDPSEGIDERTAVGEYDAFLMKFSVNGDYLWTVTYGSESGEEGRAVAISEEGVVVAGYFGSTVDFDPGLGIDERTSAGSSDIFITKLSFDGDYLWTYIIGGTGHEFGYGLVVVGGSIYMAGEFTETIDFDSGPGVDERVSNGDADAFVTKLGGDGTYEWTWAAGGPLKDFANDIDVCDDSGVVVAGAFQGASIDFDPGEAVDERTSNGEYDVFISKLDADGGYEWTHAFGGTDSEFAYSVAAGFDGNVVVIGAFGIITSPPGYPVDFNPPMGDVHASEGKADIFAMMLDCDGNYQWTYTAGGTGSDVGWAVDLTEEGGAVLAGYFSDIVDFDPTGAEDIHTSAGVTDVFFTDLTCSEEPPACDGDANGDGVVDPLDSGYVLSRFGCPVNTGDEACDAADQNSDGVVDPLDVGYVLSRFGDCP